MTFPNTGPCGGDYTGGYGEYPRKFNRALVRSVMFPRGHADRPGAVLVCFPESPFTER